MNVLLIYSLLYTREKMAFFTRVHLNILILPGDEIRSESSTLTRGESLLSPEAEEEVDSEGDDEGEGEGEGEGEEEEELESSEKEDNEPEEGLNVIVKGKIKKEKRDVEGNESKVVMENNSEITTKVEDSRTVEGSETLESNKENQRFDYVVDRILGVEV